MLSDFGQCVLRCCDLLLVLHTAYGRLFLEILHLEYQQDPLWLHTADSGS